MSFTVSDTPAEDLVLPGVDVPGAVVDPWFEAGPLPYTARPAVRAFDIDNLVDLVVRGCLSRVFTDQQDDESFAAQLRLSVDENAVALCEVLLGRIPLDEVELGHVLSFATVQAQLGIPQMAMHRSYRVSFFLQWKLWSEHLRKWAPRLGYSEDQTIELLHQLTRSLLSYQDHVASQVAATYTRDHEALSRSRAHVRQGIIRDLLRAGVDQEQLTTADLAILGYTLDADHVAIVFSRLPEAELRATAQRLRKMSAALACLPYRLSLTQSVVWLARPQWPARVLARVGQSLHGEGVVATLSDPAGGVEGFRSSLEQCCALERVREAWGEAHAPLVVSTADAGLEMLLIQDERLAHAFVVKELGQLADDSTESVRLRETLEASFGLGSHVATAEHLQLHEHTVRNRLHKAEEILGHSLLERRTELQVAMRLVRLLGRPDALTQE